VASLVSSTRSAARATYSAYKRQPIRWRLAGGSAALTLVILLGFAVIVGTLTTRAIYKDFNRQVSSAADRLQAQQYYEYYRNDDKGHPQYRFPIDLDAFAASTNAAIRVVTGTGRYFASSKGAPNFGRPISESEEIHGWKVETREIQIYAPANPEYDFRIFAQYGRRISDVRATANRVKLFLGLGVLGGTALALLAGLATARRAMEPIAELTDAAREIARTRDPAGVIPRPQADD
jgi:two-component system, OmpR family, sensor kinase